MKREIAKLVLIDKMVFIPTCPRSGSSATAGIIDGLGAFGGKIIGATRANTKGQFENQSIHRLFRSELSNADLRGSRETSLALARCGGMPTIKNLRAKLSIIMEDQGYEGGTAYFKHANFMFQFAEIERNFPDCIWILPKRDPEEIAMSMVSIGMFSDKAQARKQVKVYHDCYKLIEENCTNVFSIDTIQMVRDQDFSEIKAAVTAADLIWDEDVVSKWISPDLFIARDWDTIEKEKPWEDHPRRGRRRGRRAPPLQQGRNNARDLNQVTPT